MIKTYVLMKIYVLDIVGALPFHLGDSPGPYQAYMPSRVNSYFHIISY